MDQDTVTDLVVQMMGVALKVAGPVLMVGLVIGLVVSVVQAVTQIQEQTLSFIPKVAGLVVVVIVAGPWMLSTITGWTIELWSSIPNYVGS